MARKNFRVKTASDPYKRDSITFENFQGVNIVDDNTNIPNKLVPFAKNADFSKVIGAVSKRDGVKQLIPSLGVGSCTGIHTYKSNAGDRVLFGWGNSLYKLAGIAGTVEKTSQVDWQAGSGYNVDLTTIAGEILMAAAPTENFTRASSAYTQAGVKMANDAPRYEAGVFGNGVFIEQGTTNLIVNPNFNTDKIGWNNANASNFNATSTEFARMTDGGAMGSTYSKLGDGATNYRGMATAANISVTAGSPYTLSYYFRVTNTASRGIVGIRCFNGSGTNITGSVTPPTGWVYSSSYDALYDYINNDTANEWKRHVSLFTVPTGVAAVAITFQYYDGGDKYVHVGAIQFENKKFVTSFIDGSRSNEVLKYHIPAQLPAEFIAGGVFKPDWDSTTNDVGGGYPQLLNTRNDAWTDSYSLSYVTASNNAENKHKFVFEKYLNNSWHSNVLSTPLSFSKGDTVRWVIAQLTQAYDDLAVGIHLWVKVNDGAVLHFNNSASLTTGNSMVNVYVGENSNGVTDNMFVENIAIRNAIGQVINEQSINDILNNGSAYSVNAATLLFVSGDSTIKAPRNPATWISPVYDLGSAPELATIEWATDEPTGTDCAVKIRGSSDNETFGAWVSPVNGGSVPYARYQQIRLDMTTTDTTKTPAFKDLTIDYESDLNTAISIKSGLSGAKIRFTNYNNKVYWTAGGRIQVFDGTTNRDVGLDAPASKPTVAAGAGTGLTGTYKCAVSFVTDDGFETNPSEKAEVTVSNKDIAWSNIPVGGARVVSRNLYRTKAGGSDLFYIDTIDDNTTTTYTDTVADGSLVSLAVTSNNPPKDATIIHAHKNYMFYVSADDPRRLYHSKVTEVESYPSYYYKLFPGDIIAVRSYNNYLIVSGINFTKVVEGSVFGGSLDDSNIRDLDDIGALSHEGLSDSIDPKLGNVLTVPTPHGVGYVTPGVQEKSLSRIPLSRNVQPYFDQAVNRNNIASVYSENRLLVAFNTPTSTHNDAVLCFDFRTGEWSGIWTLAAAGFAVANRKVYLASSTDGIIYQMFSGTSDAGVAIEFLLDTIYETTKYGAPYKKKFIQSWFTVSDDSKTDTLKLHFKVDNQGGTVLPGKTDNWNVGTWSGDIYGRQNVIISPKMKIPAGRGHYFGVRIEDNSTNAFTIHQIITEYEPPIIED